MSENSSEYADLESLFLIPREVPKLVLKSLLELIYDVEVTGMDFIPPTGGAVIVCNHTDYLDIPVQGVYCPRKIIYLGKYELFNPQEQILEYVEDEKSPFQIPPLNFLKPYIRKSLESLGGLISKQMQHWGSLPIIRNYQGNDVKEAMKYYDELENFMVDLVKQGEILSVYPEGTRTETGQMGPFRALAAKIAIRANAPIIPSGIAGAWNMSKPEAFLTGRAFKSKIRYNVGRPMDPKDYPDGNLKKASKQLTEEMAKRVLYLTKGPERRETSRGMQEK